MNENGWPVFVAYWPCGKCICGFQLDRGRDYEASPLLVPAIREGRKVERINGSGPIYVKTGCDCQADEPSPRTAEWPLCVPACTAFADGSCYCARRSPLKPYDVTCAQCGKVLPCDEAYVEEGDEWECPECWKRCEAEERTASSRTVTHE